jgi:uncharacterized protein YdhG (YjbR/CyaY superfamily)
VDDAAAGPGTVDGTVDPAVQAYLDGVAPTHRPLLDRVHGVVMDLQPGAELVLRYKMPTYQVGEHQLHVAVWKHGLSLYGWREDRDGGFVERHPEMSSGKGTIRIPLADAGTISDDELRGLIGPALGG